MPEGKVAGAEASLCYALALAAGLGAAFAGVWWLVALSSVAGGTGYAVAGARWMDRYRHDPARLGRGESALLLVAMGVPFAVAAVLLVIER